MGLGGALDLPTGVPTQSSRGWQDLLRCHARHLVKPDLRGLSSKGGEHVCWAYDQRSY